MRILILSFFYQPEPNDIKAHVLGRELAARGHEVTAITTFPNYPDGRIYPGYQQKWRTWEDKDGVRLLRIPLYPNHTRSGVKRALSYLSFMASAMLIAPFLVGKADILWVFTPPLTTGIAGLWLSLVKRAPFVFEIQDMWPETLASTGMLNNQRALAVVGSIAKFIYKRAAVMAVNSPGFKQNLLDKGVPEEKVEVFPNWADEDIYQPAVRDTAFGEQFGLTNYFNIIFAGNMGLAQGLDTVLDAAEMLRELPDVQFVLIGDGLELENLQNDVKKRQLSNVRFIERQPATMMPHFFAWGDVLLVSLKDDPLFAITIPSKTLAYMACGRPILCAVRGDGAEIIRESGAGVVCPPQDAFALASAVKTLYTTPQSDREAMGKAGRNYFLQHFTRKMLIDRYEALFKKIVSGF